jgi:dihydrolipoamide dehydrogenase
MSATFDVVVIGSGPGGYVAAIRAAQLGMSSACVEMEALGGVCLNWGCIPSKALLKSAEYANLARELSTYGIEVGDVTVDVPKIVKRSRRVAKKSEKGVQYLFKKYGVTLIKGRGRLDGDGKISVTDADGKVSNLSARHIIVSTGARARWFPGMEPDGETVVTYREAIVRPKAPMTAIVLGAGAIGLEFAYFYNAMGAKVTLIEAADRVAPLEDEEVSLALEKALTKQGIVIRTGVAADTVRVEDGQAVVTLAGGERLEAELGLLALGVRPNTEDLGLDVAGVRLDQRGFIETDASCATSARGVFAIGDVAGAPMLAHKASAEAHVCVERLAGHTVSDVGFIPSGIFCQPQVASFGQTEAELVQSGVAHRVGRFPFAANGKARGTGHIEGFVKVLVGEAFGEILGAHAIGHDVTELLGELVLAAQGEIDAETFLRAVHSHPTTAEAVMEAVAVALGVSVHI